MTTITELGRLLWRNFVDDGDSESGIQEVSKSEARAFAAAIDAQKGEGVADLAAIKALTSRPPVVFVKALDGFFIWYAGSTETPDDETVIECTSGTAGRYLLWVAGGGGGGGGSEWETGDYRISSRASTSLTGWVKVDDGTIGNAASSATTRANADTADLFAHLWNTFSNSICAVSGGRGANAAADFAANKTIALSKMLGRALIVAGTGSGLTARAAGASGGVESVTANTSQTNNANLASGSFFTAGGTVGTTDAFSVMQPWTAVNVFMKL